MCPRYDNEWVEHMLDAQSRIGPITPEDLLRESGLETGQSVIDLGCGPGFLTIPAAKIVGSSGRVYAVDTEQEMLDLINSRVSESELNNVQTIFTDGGNIPLPDESADYVICGLILHDPPEFAERVNMARDVSRLIRPNGRVIVIERSPESGQSHGHQLTPDETGAILQEAGLEHGEARTLVGTNYMMVAKPATSNIV